MKVELVTVDRFEAKMRRILDLKQKMHDNQMTLNLSSNDSIMYTLWVESWKTYHRLEIVRMNRTLKALDIPYRIVYNHA